MLDRGLLRNEPEKVREAAKAKGEPCPIDRWLELDINRRSLLGEVEEQRRRRNELSKEVASIRKSGGDASSQMDESREAGRKVGLLEKTLSEIDAEMKDLDLCFPNIPDPDVPIGPDESFNIVQGTWGEIPDRDFETRPHWDLMGDLLDSAAAGAVTGSNFLVLRGWAAWLQRSLISWMLDFHMKAGMEEIWSPFLASRESMTTTGQIPKLEDDMYHIEKDDLFLIPTGEVPLTNLYRGCMLREDDLPVRLFGYTPSFRREAGSYGKETRGLNRVHQFEKIEMVQLSHPDSSEAAQEEMVAHVEEMLRLLELPYRISLLATGDLSFAAAKCYDLEVWSAGQKRWLEVSSVSNFRDFQARRGNMRFKPAGGGKPLFLHTLNGSGIALPRIMSAIIENGQTADGLVRLPRVLAERTGREFLND